MKGVTFNVIALGEVADFVPRYVSEASTSELSIYSSKACTHCLDAGWLAPAEFRAVGTYRDEVKVDGQIVSRYSSSTVNNLCRQHLVSEVENFRDAGQ